MIYEGKNARVFLGDKEIGGTSSWKIKSKMPWYKIPIVCIGKLFNRLKFYI